MRNQLALFILAGFLFGCGEDPYQVELLRTEEPFKATVSCLGVGMCFSCTPMVDSSGNFKQSCGIKFSGTCPGQRDVMKQTSVYKLYFKDKDPEIEEVNTVVQTLSSCRT